MEGRLAAILACDVVGYSRAMRVDETGTLERLKACRRRLIDPRLARYCERVIKLMGDCALVGFASAVDSVSFAVSMQHAMANAISSQSPIAAPRDSDIPRHPRTSAQGGQYGTHSHSR